MEMFKQSSNESAPPDRSSATSSSTDTEATVLVAPELSELSLDALNPEEVFPMNGVRTKLTHLDRTLYGSSPRQLSMIMVGEGGIGKSRVIPPPSSTSAHEGKAPASKIRAYRLRLQQQEAIFAGVPP